MKYTISYLNEHKCWLITRLAQAEQIKYELGIKETKQKLSEIESAIKILNEATVERSELIDFMRWFLNRPCNYDTKNVAESIVDTYIKSINAAKRN